MMNRSVRAVRRLVRGVGALTVLAALLSGVPWALAKFVGWPLPRAVPSFGEVGDALNGASISDAVLIKTLASAAWVLWTLLVVSFVVETRAWVRGREAHDVRFAGFVQPVMRELVVSAALVIGSLRPAGLAAPALVPVSEHAATVRAAAVSSTTTDPGDAAPALPTCVVKPRDSLWKLADDHLGDGLRWRELWELNRGRTFPDGRRFVDPSLINPGWVLSLPRDAVVQMAVPPTIADPVPPPPAPVTTSTTTSAPGVMPAPTVAEVRAPSTTNGTTPPAASLVEDDPDYETKPLLAGSALVAAGVIVSLARLRRRQLRHRAPGRMPKLPEPDAARAEVHLRRAAVGAPFDRLDLALRVLAHCLGRRASQPCPAVDVVSVGPEAIEILLTHEVDAPAGPFLIEAKGRAWTLPASVPDADLRAIADTQAGPTPALVTIGTIDERSVLVDLEAMPCTLVGGDPADAAAFLWTLAFDLVTSNRADDLNVIVVGSPPPGLDAVGRARVVEHLDDVIDELEAEAGLTASSLRSRRLGTTLEARVRDPADVLTPTLVLVATNEPGLDRALKAAHDNAALAVVVAGEPLGDFDRELCVEGDTLVLKPLGLRLAPGSLPPDVLGQAGELLRVAADVEPGEPLDLRAEVADGRGDGLRVGPDQVPLEFDVHGRPVVPTGHVMVRVLGSVEIIGGHQPIDRRRSVELVTYLALHPEGVDDGRLRTALWPEGAPTQAAFNETVSRARRMLGLDRLGNHHLPHVDNRRYRVGPYVFTDAELLEQNYGSDNTDVLRLVRGLPFDGTSGGYEWAFEEGQAHRLLVLVEEAGSPAATTEVNGRLPLRR
jgi:hypothetical protein